MLHKHVICTLLLALVAVTGVQAQTLKELQAQQKKYAEELETTDKMLKQTKQNEKSTENKLNLISQDIRTRKKLINSINQEIIALDQEQSRLQGERSRLEGELDSLKQDYARLIQLTHYADIQQSPLLFLLSAQDFNQLFRRIRYMREFATYRQQQVERIENVKADIQIQSDLIQDNRKEKDSALKTQQRERDRLAGNERKQKTMLKNLKQQEKELIAKQRKQQKKIDELNKQIERAIAKQVDRKQQLTKEQELIAGGFAANKGRLPWPVAKGFISGHYGKHQHPIYENVTLNNKGVYIQTTAGSDARAVYEGEVTTCMVMGSTYAIIIQHGNYRTVYTGIQTPAVKPGDKVQAKQNIGRIASNPDDDNKTELQFQVWQDRDLQNPELWLAQ
ncbi:MAG: peptidoglycan DD-metalloendopeptidase family protein [Paludibacteraceae bacterium]|nr:peptidoglycan DD-metalloendopeptidase family protein [Paludibacteraceae bacterium]